MIGFAFPALILGILTAVCWGAGDFLNARASRRTRPLSAWVYSFELAGLAA